MRLKETPSQTAGPYVHIGCVPNFAGIEGVYPRDLGQEAFAETAPGDRIEIAGRVIDGTGTPLRDVMIETWQAGADGVYGPGMQGWARIAADQDTGEWRLCTVRPGQAGPQAPHVTFWIVARGINLGLHTRMYFPEEEAANAADPLLARIEHRSRVPTLIARPEGEGRYRFDIRLQGDGETVFLDI